MRSMSFADFGKSEFLGIFVYNLHVVVDKIKSVHMNKWWNPPFVNEAMENPPNYIFKVAMHFAEETSVDLETSMVGSKLYFLVDGVERSANFSAWRWEDGIRAAEYIGAGSATGTVYVTMEKIVDASGVVRWRNPAI